MEVAFIFFGLIRAYPSFPCVVLFPKKTMFALDFNPINFYPWKDAFPPQPLVGPLLEVLRHSWRETLCGLRCKSSLEISCGDVHDRGVPCPLSSPEKWTRTSRPWCSPLQRELEPLADFPSWCWRMSSSSPNAPEDLMMGRCLLPVIVANPPSRFMKRTIFVVMNRTIDIYTCYSTWPEVREILVYTSACQDTGNWGTESRKGLQALVLRIQKNQQDIQVPCHAFATATLAYLVTTKTNEVNIDVT